MVALNYQAKSTPIHLELKQKNVYSPHAVNYRVNRAIYSELLWRLFNADYKSTNRVRYPGMS